MTTKEFSNLYGLSVNEMCELTGLSRQGLNEIVLGKSTKRSTSKQNALHELREYAAMAKLAAMTQLEIEYRERIKAAEIFNV